MATYNAWQNRSLYGAASTLSDEQRKADRGAFFGSIHATLSHILFGDQAWMHRFAGTPKPAAASIAESTSFPPDWSDLMGQRPAFDAVIQQWADRLTPADLEGDLTWYSGSIGRDVTRPRWLLVTHMFNHQTHHRGQVHTLLTGFGAKPEATDIPFMPSLK
jgi:uncharacterized damage-inducible protein DinB